MRNLEEEFNEEQREAIKYPYNQDLVLSAGAGSGKTKTLTEKVYRIISSGQIKPNELLVLTFTNNAAHEMKERIIKKFKEEDSPLANEILSAHIQTFDSFSSFLVKSYASELNISQSFTIISKISLEAKINKTIEDIFNEYYEDDTKRERLVNSLRKFSLFKDEEHKKILFSLYNFLSNLNNKRREQFIRNCVDNFYTTNYFDECLNKLIDNKKDEIRKILVKAYIIDRYKRNKDLLDLTKDDLYEIDNIDVLCLVFSNEYLQGTYKCFKELLLCDNPVKFIAKSKELLSGKDEYVPSTMSPVKKWFEKEDIYSFQAMTTLREVAPTKGTVLSIFGDNFDYDNELNKYLYFKEDAELFIEMYLTLQDRILDYKKSVNAYTFFDINNMALSLLEETTSCSKEILSRFKYILVDEYQDTNGFKEELLNAFLRSGESHLFCVGDAKQSIFGFTGSDVSLFKDRAAITNTIDMNKNYRSGKKLIKDMNYIFSHYLSLEYGGIDYKDVKEQLQYDDTKNIYSEPYDNFGVKRIVSTSESNDDNFFGGPLLWEIKAIINDIKKKIDSGYLISKRTNSGNKIVKADYKDFVILTRVKTNFNIFLEEFAKNNIPLNVIESSNLREIDAVIVMQSLLKLVAYEMELFPLTGNELKHLFASVARSYLFEYDDQKIFDLITGDDDFLLNDKVMLQITTFAIKEKEKSLSEIYVDLLEEFEVVNKLYLIGNVEDNVNKIDSLYSVIKEKENVCDSLKDVIEYFNDVNKYEIKFDAESVTNLSNAVTLMTVHASKGLENKVVYLPVNSNKLSIGNMSSKEYIDEKLGFIFPYYNFDVNNKDDDGEIKSIYTKTITELLKDDSKIDDKEEISEHRRLYYVALTRAENTVYIVGDEDSQRGRGTASDKEGVYTLLKSGPSYQMLNPKLLDVYLKRGLISQEEIDKYNQRIEIFKQRKYDGKFLNNKINEEAINDLLSQRENDLIKDQNDFIDDVMERALEFYKEYYLNNNDEEFKARVLSQFFDLEPLDSFDKFADAIVEKLSSIDEDGELPPDELRLVAKGIIQNMDKLFMGETPDDNGQVAMTFVGDKTPDPFDKGNIGHFILALDGVSNFAYISFETDAFEDKKEVFDYKKVMEPLKERKPEYQSGNINDEKILFDEIVKRRASKLTLTDENMDIQEILKRGSYLHKLLELTNVRTKDTSFIKNEKDRKLIDRVLTNPIFDLAQDGEVYQEYGYYDEVYHTTGSIDLLIIRNGEYHIIDYKSKHVEDDGYEEQLHTYQRNVMQRFNINDNIHIHLYLLSIADNKLFEVKPQ